MQTRNGAQNGAVSQGQERLFSTRGCHFLHRLETLGLEEFHIVYEVGHSVRRVNHIEIDASHRLPRDEE